MILVLAVSLGCLAATLGACSSTGDDGAPSDTTANVTGDTAAANAIPVAPTDSVAADTAAAYATDPAQIVEQMKARYEKMGGMEGVNIKVTEAGGIVLEGHVPTTDRKQTAEDVARVIAGNVPVDNRLGVRAR